MDDLWADDDVTLKERSSAPLFLPEEPEHQHVTNAVDPPMDDIDALFAEMEADLAPAPDLDAIRKHAAFEARVALRKESNKRPGANALDLPATQVVEEQDSRKRKHEEDEGPKKPKRAIAKLDDQRLIGPKGFPALLKEAKKFEPRGKSHEAADLARLLEMYQYWTHQMFPKLPFRQTAQRVERVCRTRRMQVSLGVWRDDFHGVKRIDTEEPLSDGEDDGEDGPSSSRATSPPISQRVPSSAPESEGRAPTTSATTRHATNDDEETMWEELMAGLGNKKSTSIALAEPQDANDSDEDADLWQTLDNMETEGDLQEPSAPLRSGQNVEDDEDMWDAIRQMEEEEAISRTTAGPKPTNEELSTAGVEDDDWDDMYVS